MHTTKPLWIKLLTLALSAMGFALCSATGDTVSNLPDSFYNRAGLENMPRIDYASMKVVNVRDMGAIGDGEHDETAAFQNAVDALPATGGVVFIPEGTYYFAEPAAPERRGWNPRRHDGTGLRNIHFVGTGEKSAIIFRHRVDFRYPNAYYGWNFNGLTNSSFRDLRLSCETLSDQRWWPGIGVYPIAFSNAENVQILRVTVDQGEIGICFWRPSRNVWVVGNTIRNTGADGIHFENSVHATVAYNLIENSGDDGIATIGFHALKESEKGEEMLENRFLYNTVIGVSWGRGLLCGGEKMDVIGNRIEGAVYAGIYIQSHATNTNAFDFPVSDCRVYENRVTRCNLSNRPDQGIRGPGPSAGGGIRLEDVVSSVEIARNHISENFSDGVLFQVSTSHDIHIHDNAFINNTLSGLGVHLKKDGVIDSLQTTDNLFQGNLKGPFTQSTGKIVKSTPADLGSQFQSKSSEPLSPYLQMINEPDETAWQPATAANTSQLPVLNVRDFGAVGDGKTNDTPAFTKAFDEIPKTGAVLKIPAAHYLLLSPETDPSPDTATPHTLSLNHKKNVHLIGEGTNSVLTLHGHSVNGLRLFDCDDSSIESLTLTCDDPPGYRNNRHLIEVTASHNIRLDSLNLDQSSGSGIVLDSSRRVEVSRCIIKAPSLDGITAAASRQVWIHDCEINSSIDHAVRITWRGSICRTPQWVLVEKNTIGESRFAASVAILSGDHVDVVDNDIRSGRLGAIAVYEKARIFSPQHLRIAHNRLDLSPSSPYSYVEGAIGVWNVVCSKNDKPRTEITIEENRFGPKVTTPIWIALRNSTLNALTLKDNTRADGSPVPATFDLPDKLKEQIVTYHP